MEKSEKTCNSCYYYRHIKGECHRYPPICVGPLNVVQGDVRHYLNPEFVFPEVSENEWCGEYAKS